MTVPNSQHHLFGENREGLNVRVRNEGVKKIVAGYTIQQRLGSGSFATVFKGVKAIDSSSNSSSNVVAIKAVNRNSEKLTKKILDNLELEISILRTYLHPNIVCLHEVHKTDYHFYLILEFCGGGDLQQLIRSRRSGRLTESLARRLMRDLSSGLKFLWSHQLIHRDIKPQNLLLTGCLPLDEKNDPSKIDTDEDLRLRTNFPSESFHLKIADFGFARHLQTTSLADTLCGSPLYMAPEILQHRRYDAKADLWSAGAVLFEMIAGQPPFNGENHIDLLHNIQRKAVKLPFGVSVSTECVSLLKILLCRNPASRAGLDEFIEASNEFVGLGCNGSLAEESQLNLNLKVHKNEHHSSMAKHNLGPISEVEESTHQAVRSTQTSSNHETKEENNLPRHKPMMFSISNQESDETTTHSIPEIQHKAIVHETGTQVSRSSTNASPPSLISQSLGPPNNHHQPFESNNILSNQIQKRYDNSKPHLTSKQYSHFTPLEPSPPGTKILQPGQGIVPPPLNLGANAYHGGALHGGRLETHGISQQQQQHSIPDSSQTASDDCGFVIVEHGIINNCTSSTTSKCILNPANFINQEDKKLTRSPFQIKSWKETGTGRTVVPSSYLAKNTSVSPSNSPREGSPRYYTNKAGFSSRNLIKSGIAMLNRGMLSTSPGTGGALVGIMGSPTSGKESMQRMKNKHQYQSKQLSSKTIGKFNNTKIPCTSCVKQSFDLGSIAKILAAAEDVGRRAIQVAHLGDTRAYFAMKLIMTSDEGLSLVSESPMEGVEEASNSSIARLKQSCNESLSDTYQIGNRRAVSFDLSSTNNCKNFPSDDEYYEDGDDDMPFAMNTPSKDSGLSMTPLPRRQNSSNIDHPMKESKEEVVNISEVSIRSYFSEALSCYMKALSMLKSSVNAAVFVQRDINGEKINQALDGNIVRDFQRRCYESHSWLSSQFRGVLERADAANTEVEKLQSKANNPSVVSASSNQKQQNMITVEELIYNHSLACGKDGAVKQLLGQFDAARSCYRSAGLLAETLLMESKLCKEDKKVLEDYVHGFSERITELDSIMIQQSGKNLSHLPSSDGALNAPISRRKSSITGNTDANMFTND